MKKAGTTALQLLYPMATYCVCCGNLIDQSRSYCLCDHCIRRIEWGWLTIDLAAQEAETGRTSDLDSAVACISYGLYGRRLIFDLKYNKHTYTARVIADILADRICSDPDTRHLLRTDFIVPVPLHAKRLAQRGFNQTAKIGKHLERRLRESRIEDLTEKKSLETAAERRAALRADDGITKPDAPLIKLEGWESDVFCEFPKTELCASHATGVPREAQDARAAAEARRDTERMRDAVPKQEAVRKQPHYPRLLADALLRVKATTPQRALSAEERCANLNNAFAIAPAFLSKLAGARILLLDDAYTTGATANQCARVLKEAGVAEVHLAALATGNHFASGHFPKTQQSSPEEAWMLDAGRLHSDLGVKSPPKSEEPWMLDAGIEE